jgi:hypothetical protein
MQKRKLAAKRESAFKRRINAIERLRPGLIECLSGNLHRELPRSGYEIVRCAVPAALKKLNVDHEKNKLTSSPSYKEAREAAMNISLTYLPLALDNLNMGLRNENKNVRRASAQAISDLFLLGANREERWEALHVLVRANDEYIPEASAQLREVLDLGSWKIKEIRNTFKKISDLLSKPAFGVGLGGAGATLLKFGFFKSGGTMLGLAVIFGSLEQIIKRRGKIKYPEDSVVAKAYSLLEQEA